MSPFFLAASFFVRVHLPGEKADFFFFGAMVTSILVHDMLVLFLETKPRLAHQKQHDSKDFIRTLNVTAPFL
jgi:hypothetical protein